MGDKTKNKVNTVKATAKALADTDQRIDGATVGKVITEQVKQQHS